jgi:hypothetical protein
MPLGETEYWEIRPLFINARAAGLETHIAVCEFLHFIQDNFMPGLNVYDETNYFETADVLRAETILDSDTTAQDGEVEPATPDPFAPQLDESELAAAGTADPKLQSRNPRARNRSSQSSNPQADFPPRRKPSSRK